MFTWDPCYEAAVKKRFATKAGAILKRALYDLRRGRTKSGFIFMGAEKFASMQAKWETEDWLKNSQAGHAGRTSKKGKGKAVYTGGSVSTAMHQSRLVSIYSYK